MSNEAMSRAKGKARGKLSEQIRATLTEEIMSGTLRVGARIDEQLIADRFGVSRTPAREALLQMSLEGIVELLPRRGAVVKAVTTREYIGMIEVLIALEALAARLCVRRVRPDQMQQLIDALESCKQAALAGDEEAYKEANSRFHETIYAAAHNEVLAKEIRRLRERLTRVRRHQLFSLTRMRSSALEHEAVLNAILAGDENDASAAMENHISKGGNSFADVLASLPQ